MATMEFSQELELFRTRTQNPGYRALIVLGSRQATTAALLIGALRPERVGFLLTADTTGMVNEVKKLLNPDTTEGWVIPEGSHETASEVYQGLRQVFALWNDLDPAQIAADVTGGLKPMSVGLEKAAHVLGLQTVYIRSDYDRVTKQTIPGTQTLEKPPDPYEVFGHLQAAEASNLYTAHDYNGAKRIYADLAARVSPPDSDEYAALATIAAAYGAWDAFDLTQAERHIQALLGKDLPPSLVTVRTVLEAQHAALGCLTRTGHKLLQSKNPTLDVLTDRSIMLALLGSLHANANRRYAQGRYDIAALLQYRCLELMSQHRLATYGITTHQAEYADVLKHVPDLSSRYQKVLHAHGRRKFSRLPEYSIGLFAGYMLLAALDDPLVKGYPIKQIENRNEARNKSILAHGYRLITEQEYRAFADVVNHLLVRFLALLGVNRAAWMQDYAFLLVPKP